MTNEFAPEPPKARVEPDPLDPTVPLVPGRSGVPPVPQVSEPVSAQPVPQVPEPAGLPPIPQVSRSAWETDDNEAPDGPDFAESGPGKMEDAKAEAGELGKQGMDSARQVASTAKEEAAHVAGEVKRQASDLFGELGTDLREQAGIQQDKLAENLRNISEELLNMLKSSDEQGTAASLVRQAAHTSGGAADWLNGRDPGSLLEEVKGFARQRPGTFLAIAAGAGLLVGRLARGVAGATSDEAGKDSGTTDRETPAPEHADTAGPRPNTLGQAFPGGSASGNPTLGSKGIGGTGGNPGVGFDAVGPADPERGYPGS